MGQVRESVLERLEDGEYQRRVNGLHSVESLDEPVEAALVPESVDEVHQPTTRTRGPFARGDGENFVAVLQVFDFPARLREEVPDGFGLARGVEHVKPKRKKKINRSFPRWMITIPR